MNRSGSARAVLTGLTTAAVAAGMVILGSGGAQAAEHHQASGANRPMPSRVVAPYYESWMAGSPAAAAAQSGNKYLTMAFLQTAAPGSCTAYWNGDTTTPIASSSFGSDIAAIQAAGGNVIPSFGGYGADTTNTDIADSCTDVKAIAAVYESLVTTYHVTRIDLDIEADSLSNAAGIDRRNKAVALAEHWAQKTGHSLQFSYTMPTTFNGLLSNTLAVLQNAIANDAHVSVVNIMTFDYYDGAYVHDMAADTISAATDVHTQLAALYPDKGSAGLWSMIGVTEMPGIDDYGADETFTTANAATVEQWAASKKINTLSFWALQRDNGGCVGTGGAGDCSGVAQSTWQFSHAFEPFGLIDNWGWK